MATYIFAYNALPDNLCKNGMFGEADRLFNEMLDRGLVPNEVTYHIPIHSLCERGVMEDALHMFDRMREKEVRVTVYPYISLINNCCKKGGFRHGSWDFWGEMAKIGVTLNVASYSPLIAGLYREGGLSSAMELHQRLLHGLLIR